MELKIIIITPINRNIQNVVNTIGIKDETLTVSKKFINDEKYKNTENEEGYYYIDNNKITESLKNNSVLYVTSNASLTTGVMFDDFYNSDIIIMSISEFNSISTNFINSHKDNILLMWVDTKYKIDTKTLNKDINEVTYLLNKINTYDYKYIYLLDPNQEELSDIVIDYYYADDEKRQQIIEENS